MAKLCDYSFLLKDSRPQQTKEVIEEQTKKMGKVLRVVERLGDKE